MSLYCVYDYFNQRLHGLTNYHETCNIKNYEKHTSSRGTIGHTVDNTLWLNKDNAKMLKRGDQYPEMTCREVYVSFKGIMGILMVKT